MNEKVSYDEYLKIQFQIAELETKAKAVGEALLADEIKTIKAKIKELGLKPSQLFSAAVLSYESQATPVTMGEKIKNLRDVEPSDWYCLPLGENVLHQSYKKVHSHALKSTHAHLHEPTRSLASD